MRFGEWVMSAMRQRQACGISAASWIPFGRVSSPTVPLPGRRRRAWLAGVVLLTTTAMSGHAVTPLSPRLDATSRISLFSTLSDNGISDVAGSAVLVALLAVLGAEPAVRRYGYREPYPHLPDVDAETSLAEPPCVEVRLDTRPKAGRPLIVAGIFCLDDRRTLTWTGTALAAEVR